jgi:glyceraldehyde 3-phosphate dehydrogenase
MVNFAVNGFGRIGGLAFGIATQAGHQCVGINDLISTETMAHLLKYDTTHGQYPGEVEAGRACLIVDGNEIPVFAERDPSKLPWADLKVDVAIEATGVFRTGEGERGGYRDHLKAGAKKVLLTVPAKDAIDRMIVLGVNDHEISPEASAYSNASCTTNCLAPLAMVLNNAFGIKLGLMTTVHAYTNDQNVLDGPHKDLYRARAAAQNIIPTSTGAAKAVGKIIPELDGTINGMAMRVPVLDGSIVDLTAVLGTDVTADDVNAAVEEAAAGPLKGILQYMPDKVVSGDIIGNPHSSIFVPDKTMMMGARMVKVLSWYDNEFGYASRVVELMAKIMGV